MGKPTPGRIAQIRRISNFELRFGKIRSFGIFDLKFGKFGVLNLNLEIWNQILKELEEFGVLS